MSLDTCKQIVSFAHISCFRQKTNFTKAQKLLIFYEPVYHQSVRELAMELQNSDTPISTIVTANIPKFASKSIASTISSPSHADTEADVNGDNETWSPQLIYNSSHMQMRNNEAIRDLLTQLYDGQFGDFFETERSEWEPEGLTEQPLDIAEVRRRFSK